MLRLPKGVSSFLRKNALALASLSIAGMGLYLTITSQSDERSYKELMIRPNLGLYVEVKDFSVSVVNRGLGPALVTDTFYYLDGECGTLTRTNVAQADIIKIIRGVGHYFSQQFTELTWGEYKSGQGIQIRVPLPNEIISVGQKIPLFKLDQSIVDETNSKLHALAGLRQAIFDDEFARHAMEVPLASRYCSMSEKYCAASMGRTIPCQFPTLGE